MTSFSNAFISSALSLPPSGQGAGSTISDKGLPENLVARINPLDARAYVASSGWNRVPGVNGTVAVYAHPSSDLDQLIVPLDTGASDYGRRMAEVVASLAQSERRPAAEVLNDLLLPPSDVLRFRLVEPESEPGVLPLEKGINLPLGAKKALLALPAGKSSDILIRRHDLNLADQSGWPEQHRWLRETPESFHKVFAPRIKALNAETISAEKVTDAWRGRRHQTPFAWLLMEGIRGAAIREIERSTSSPDAPPRSGSTPPSRESSASLVPRSLSPRRPTGQRGHP